MLSAAGYRHFLETNLTLAATAFVGLVTHVFGGVDNCQSLVYM